jgi:hypothetical protein
MQPSEVREVLEALVPDLTDFEWAWLEDERYVDEVCRGETSVEALADAVHRLPHRRAAAAGRPAPAMVETGPTARGRPVPPPSRRIRAISDLIAGEAAEDPQVQAFREEFLPERLLAFGEIEGWIKEHQEQAPGHSRWLLELPVPQDTRLELIKEPAAEPPAEPTAATTEEPGAEPAAMPVLIIDPPLVIGRLEAKRGHGPIGRSIKTLEYAIPGDRWVRRIATRVGTPLEDLRYLSEELARRYRWQPSQATIFVLTGLTPLINEIGATIEYRGPIPALTRIALSVDPAVSPREVAERYRELRRELRPGRSRPLSEKHTELALFATERPEGESWLDQMTAWNQAHPAWRYEQPTNFARDARQAQRRLMEPDYSMGDLSANPSPNANPSPDRSQDGES